MAASFASRSPVVRPDLHSIAPADFISVHAGHCLDLRMATKANSAPRSVSLVMAANYVLGVQTSAANPEVSTQYFKQAERDFQKALGKNDNYRPARSYLVAVLSELRQPDEAKNQMNISLQKGEPLVNLLRSTDLQLADEQIRAITPFADEKISIRLGDAWRKAVN